MPRALVVDDDPMVSFPIEVGLTRKGFEIAIADGDEAGMRAPDFADFDRMPIGASMQNIRGFESIRMHTESEPIPPQTCRIRAQTEMK